MLLGNSYQRILYNDNCTSNDPLITENNHLRTHSSCCSLFFKGTITVKKYLGKKVILPGTLLKESLLIDAFQQLIVTDGNFIQTSLLLEAERSTLRRHSLKNHCKH